MMPHKADDATPRIWTRLFPWAGFGLSVAFWVVDSAIDSALLDGGTLYECLFKPDLTELYMRLLVCVLLTTIWVIVHYARLARRTEKDRRLVHDKLESALLKLLGGHIPICTYCKRIRDEKGQWTSIESYVGARTTATFSHGICPICEETEFPLESDRDVIG